MSDQLQLDLARGRVKSPGRDRPFVSARLNELIDLLENSRTWMTKAQLEAKGFSDRELRELAETDITGEIFSYPGSPGYKAYAFVSEAEFKRCRALLTQGKKMIHRFIRYWRRRHKGQPLPKQP
jgi:hypothetical protein